MRSRTRRNYSGIENPVKKMTELLPEILSDLTQKSGHSSQEIFQFLCSLMGEKITPFTELVSWQNGVLTVKVKSSTLYSLLAVHERARLLAKLKEKFSIRNLVFRVG